MNKKNHYFIGTIIFIVFCFQAYGAKHLFDEQTDKLIQELTPVEYDYIIDLSEDSCNYVIYITDEYHHMNIIHPDSLEEFIQQDNL